MIVKQVSHGVIFATISYDYLRYDTMSWCIAGPMSMTMSCVMGSALRRGLPYDYLCYDPGADTGFPERGGGGEENIHKHPPPRTLPV